MVLWWFGGGSVVFGCNCPLSGAKSHYKSKETGRFSVVRWFGGSVVRWFGGLVVVLWWFGGGSVVVRWFAGSVVRWFAGAKSHFKIKEIGRFPLVQSRTKNKGKHESKAILR